MARLIILQHLLVTALATPPPDAFAELFRSSPVPEVNALLDELNARRRESAKALQDCGLWEVMAPAERAFLMTLPQDVTGRGDASLRHAGEYRALNWLCGYAPLNQWGDTPTDT